jgi:hypothetical protein
MLLVADIASNSKGLPAGILEEAFCFAGNGFLVPDS